MSLPGNSVVIAERIIYELLGRRWVWPPVTATEEFENVTTRFIYLQGRPVTSVDKVLVNGEEIVDFTHNRSSVKLPRKLPNIYWSTSSGWRWTGPGSPADLLIERFGCRTVEVTYVYGAQGPEGVSKSIQTYAEELDKAFAGDESCRLPERVTEISSRGIDMTVLDPMDFIKDGLTGLPEVDATIAALNPRKARVRARVFSADYQPGRRLGREPTTGSGS